MQYCPQISLVGEVSVSGSLQAMDCHITQAVQTGYERLFGPSGAFGHALQAALIIYIALIAYGFMTGRTQLTLTMMSPRIVTMVLVLTFVTAWPAYHAVFYGLLMNGPDEVAAALLGQRGSAVMHFAQGLDGLFVRFAEIAQALDGGAPGQAAAAKADATAAMLGPKPMPVTLFWLSGLFMLVSTLGALILTRMVLYLLLIIGPLFIVLGLFPQTRGLFNGWIRTSLIFSLAPMLIVLGGTAALMLFVPLIDVIGNDPQAAVKAVQPIVILFMGSIIYCAFLFTLMWVAASLVRDWQAALRDRPSNGRGSGGGSAPSPAPYMAQSPALAALSGSSRSSDALQRTEPLVTAVSRDASQSAATPAARAEMLGLYDPEARGGQGSADRFSRVQGLGQRFRSRPTSSLPAQPPIKPAETKT